MTSLIDQEIFEQLLALDEDDSREFSKDLILKYLDQADQTFLQMRDKIHSKEWVPFAKLGHFLKGSSAQLGLLRVQDCCKQIQEFQNVAQSLPDPSLIASQLLENAKAAYVDTRKYLVQFYHLNV